MSDDRPFLIGLTGSIGMGKSTTAQMFRDAGVPVWDADATVHRLYAAGGAAVAPLGQIFPSAIVDDAVDRERLKREIKADPNALRQIEAVVHPLLKKDREAFLAALDSDVAVLDFPLLFETGADEQVDLIVVVSAPPEVQKERLRERGTMNSAMLETILASQMPDVEKRARADVVIETTSMDGARRAVQELLKRVRQDA